MSLSHSPPPGGARSSLGVASSGSSPVCASAMYVSLQSPPPPCAFPSLSSAHHDGRYAPLSPEEYASAMQSARRSEAALYPTHALCSAANHTPQLGAYNPPSPSPHQSAAQRGSSSAGRAVAGVPSSPYSSPPAPPLLLPHQSPPTTSHARAADSRRASGTRRTSSGAQQSKPSSAATASRSPTHNKSTSELASPATSPLALPHSAWTPPAAASSAHVALSTTSDSPSARAATDPAAASAPLFLPPAAAVSASLHRSSDERTASIFKVPEAEGERAAVQLARRGSIGRTLSGGSGRSDDTNSPSPRTSAAAALLRRRSVLSPLLCLSPAPRRLFASPIRKFSSLSVHEANILLAAKQDKAAKLREELISRVQSKLKVAAQRVEAAEQRLQARMLQKSEAVSGRLEAAQHIQRERLEAVRRRATTENQKVAEVAFINQLTEQMGSSQGKAALDKKLSRTEQRRKQRQAEKLHVVTQQAAKHRLLLERRAQLSDDKDAVIARIQHKLDEARDRRQQRRHAAAAAAAAAAQQHDSAQMDRPDGVQLIGGVDAAASQPPPFPFSASVDELDDESFSAIDFPTGRSAHGWLLQTEQLDSADELLAADDAVCTPTHPRGRPVRRRLARPASSPAPAKHQKGAGVTSAAADSRASERADRWAADSSHHWHSHMQQYTQPPSPSADEPRVVTIYQLRQMDATHTAAHSTDDDSTETETRTQHAAGSAPANSSATHNSSSGGRQRRVVDKVTPRPCSPKDSPNLSLGCAQCRLCGVLLLSDAAHVSRHVDSLAHQQRIAASQSAAEAGECAVVVRLSWSELGRHFVQAPSKSSRRNAKKRTNKLKLHATHTPLDTDTAPHATTYTAKAAVVAAVGSRAARYVDAAMVQPVAGLLQLLDEAAAMQSGVAQCSDEWLSALLLQLRVAEKWFLLESAAERSASQRSIGRMCEEKESLPAPVAACSSEVGCALIDALLARCLCLPFPSRILAAAYRLLDAALRSPIQRQALLSLLVQQRLVPAVCAFNSWLCTLLAQCTQSQRAVQCDEYQWSVFTLLSSVLSAAAATQPAAGAVLLRVLAVSGLLRRSAQLLLCFLHHFDTLHAAQPGAQQPSECAEAAAGWEVAGCNHNCHRQLHSFPWPTCRSCSLLECALSLARFAHSSLLLCAACRAEVAVSAEVASSFRSTALLAVVPLLSAAADTWKEQRSAASSTAAEQNREACRSHSVAPLLDVCLDVCLLCSEADSAVSLAACTPSPLPLLHAALARMALTAASTRGCACTAKTTEAAMRKMAQLIHDTATLGQAETTSSS